MNEADYHRYIEAFNARDYAGLETFFADDFVLENAGFAVRGKAAFREFYAFFHEYCSEEVIFCGFFPAQAGDGIGGQGSFVANVVISFTGIKQMPEGELQRRGLAGMEPVPLGVQVDVEFYIHYKLNSDGLIEHIKGAVWIPETT